MEGSARSIHARFVELFNAEPIMVRSPGRINLIGEHTDYNDGFVMPAAIDKEIIFAIAPSPDDQCLIFSEQYQELFPVSVLAPRPVHEPKWANYLLGVLHQFVREGLPVRPFCCVFGGDIPAGAGLSSSAALECGFAFALNALFQAGVPKMELIRMAQWSEHNFVGVRCGIMDQFASMMGKQGNAILLDCRSLEFTYTPIDLGDHALLLCDTRVKHALVDSEYNTRRKECEQGVQFFAERFASIMSLRDVSPSMIEKHAEDLAPDVYKRCKYVVDETIRVQEASADLQQGDLRAFGIKMYATHDGLSRDYAVSCPELDFLVNEARKSTHVYGARMMGGGFGGCTINLIEKSAIEDFVEKTAIAYRERFSLDMESYRVSVVGGTSLLQE